MAAGEDHLSTVLLRRITREFLTSEKRLCRIGGDGDSDSDSDAGQRSMCWSVLSESARWTLLLSSIALSVGVERVEVLVRIKTWAAAKDLKV